MINELLEWSVNKVEGRIEFQKCHSTASPLDICAKVQMHRHLHYPGTTEVARCELVFIYLFIRKFTSRRTINTTAPQRRSNDTSSCSRTIQFYVSSENSYKKVSGDLSVHGNEFQTVGPHTEKAHGPKVIVLVRGTFNSRCAAERSDAVIGEVDGSATMETFVDQGGHLECHPQSNRQPVQIHYYRCDVVVFLSARYEPCRSILHTLQPVHQAFTDAVQHRVAVF